MLRLASLLAAGGLGLMPLTALAEGPSWEPWVNVPGVFDLGGPRSDGSLVVAGSAALYTLTPAGTLTPFGQAYHDDAGKEAYLAVSPGLSGQGCSFARDDMYVLRLHAPVGVTRVSATGNEVVPFAGVGLASLNGIAFDSTGAFGRRLLVTGPLNGKTEVLALDCGGAAQVITSSAPVVEGGLAVAPSGFGVFGGDLIAPDELSGMIWAIGSDGTSHAVVSSGLPKGGDIGVESLGFVPPGFSRRGGAVYLSDRATPSNLHPGTDHVLRLDGAALTAAGVEDGDLLAATEGGDSMIDVRCTTSCTVTTVVAAPTTAHGEGHVVFTPDRLPAPASPSPVAVEPSRNGAPPVSPAPFVVLAAAVLAAAAALIALSRRR